MRGDIYLHLEKWKEASDTLAQANPANAAGPAMLEWLSHVRNRIARLPHGDQPPGQDRRERSTSRRGPCVIW